MVRGWRFRTRQPRRNSGRARTYPRGLELFGHCACRKSDPNILVVQPAQDRAAKNGPGQSPNAPTRAIVVDAIRSLATTTHPDVRLSAMEIAATLPANEGGSLADVVAAGSAPMRRSSCSSRRPSHLESGARRPTDRSPDRRAAAVSGVPEGRAGRHAVRPVHVRTFSAGCSKGASRTRPRFRPST